MIERLTVRWGRLGWVGKVLVLALIGFAMTDFVLTITISAADATQHVLQNPFFSFVPNRPILIAGMLIVAAGLVFLRGFREAIYLSAAIGIPYMVMNAIVIAVSINYLVHNPYLVAAWWDQLRAFDPHQLGAYLARMSTSEIPRSATLGFGGIVFVSLVVFPKLALGLSGFETAVSVMPHIEAADLRERIVATRKLLFAAAALMSIELIGANFVSTVAIRPRPSGHWDRTACRAVQETVHSRGSRTSTSARCSAPSTTSRRSPSSRSQAPRPWRGS
jgi:hypothetical protein